MDGSNPHRALTVVVSNLALSGPDAAAWHQVCQRELQAFKEHNTYESVPLPADLQSFGHTLGFHY